MRTHLLRTVYPATDAPCLETGRPANEPTFVPEANPAPVRQPANADSLLSDNDAYVLGGYAGI